MKRLVFAVGVLALAGCEQTLPPTAEGLKLIAARTAKGTKNTKLETKTQPSPPLAGNVSIWDIKVFDINNKPDGNRKEWKFYNQLTQTSEDDKATTEVLMNAWLISKDKSVFLPQKPRYKQYGSFLTDWTIPKPGDYMLWVEYQPVKAKDELSLQEMRRKEKAEILEMEHARWEINVGGTGSGSAKPLTPSPSAGNYAVYSLISSDYGASGNMKVAISPTTAAANQKTTIAATISGASGTVGDQSFTALSPDSQSLLHGVGSKAHFTFPEKGKWRLWFTFSVDEMPFGCPVDIEVK